jgi:hypothetical protein
MLWITVLESRSTMMFRNSGNCTAAPQERELWTWFATLKNLPTRYRAVAAALMLGACVGDSLDPGGEISGPILTLAPQSVSVNVTGGPQIEYGGALRVEVSGTTTTGSRGIAAIGATALVLGSQGEVVNVIPVGRRDFSQPRQGSVTEAFSLQPLAPVVNVSALPDTLSLEVHGWALSAGGACAAAVLASGQRLPCSVLQDQYTAEGQRGTARNVIVVAPHGVSLNVQAAAEVPLGSGMNVTVSANTGSGLAGIVEMGATAIVRNSQGNRLSAVPLRHVSSATAGAVRFAQPRSGPVSEAFRLEPSAAHLNPNELPDTLNYEVHAWAISADGVCVAGTQTSSQRLPCGDYQGNRVALGVEGIRFDLRVIAPHSVSRGNPATQSVPLGGGANLMITANTMLGLAGIVELGATAIVRNSDGTRLATVPLRALSQGQTGPIRYSQPQPGSIIEPFRLEPSSLHVNLNELPETLIYEVHGWAVSADGACVASSADQSQRLQCAVSEGQVIAQGDEPRTFALSVTPPHSVGLRTAAVSRLEPHETIRFVVRTQTQLGGIQQVGVAARVNGLAGAPVDVVLATQQVDGSAAIEESFSMNFSELLARLPDGFVLPPDRTLNLLLSAYAIHQTGACVAAATEALQQLPCATVGAGRIAAGGRGQAVAITPVEGRTIPVGAGAPQIADLRVHTPSQRLFATNVANHTIEVLGLDNPAVGFSPHPIPVGSRPWGLSFNTTNDHLLVANSGGTNLSFVGLGNLQEQRVAVPRINLYQLTTNDEGILLQHFNYVDRPLYLAQDAAGRILYSAASSEVAPIGTIRAFEQHPQTAAWEARFLFPDGLLATTPFGENRAVTVNENAVAIAHVDSMELVVVEYAPGQRGFTGEVIIFDHPPGQPNNSRASRPVRFVTATERAAAMEYLRGEFQSDIVIYERHGWNLPASAQVADPVHVEASGDRRFVLFGEGAPGRISRVVLWSVANPSLTRVEDIRDMLNNSSDRINAFALNHDGTLGVARGEQGVYFFDNRLRLQGTGSGQGLAGGAGIAFIPGILPLAEQYVLAGTGRSSIQVIEPVNYRVIREVPIRSNVTGALRTAPCAAGADIGCLTTVYAVTADGVVIVNIPR